MYKVAKNGERTHKIQPNEFKHVCSFDGTFCTSYFLVDFGRSPGSTVIVVASVSSLPVIFVVFFGESSEQSAQPQYRHTQPNAVQTRQQVRNGTMRTSMTP